jgi:hypothetical protein
MKGKQTRKLADKFRELETGSERTEQQGRKSDRRSGFEI